MPLILNGDGSIQSLVAGGLPDATIQTADIVDGAIAAAKMSGAQTGSAPIYGCRAWGNFNGSLTGTFSPRVGGNVASIVKNSTGNWTVNLTTAMPDTDYSIVVTSGSSGAENNVHASPISTSSFGILAYSQGGVTPRDSTYVMFQIFR